MVEWHVVIKLTKEERKKIKHDMVEKDKSQSEYIREAMIEKVNSKLQNYPC